MDKAQVEVFTMALIAIGCVLIAQPHLAAVAFALAATQNPPFAIVSLALCVVALRISQAARDDRGERRDRDDRSGRGDDG